jgi:hypothetical protein
MTTELEQTQIIEEETAQVENNEANPEEGSLPRLLKASLILLCLNLILGLWFVISPNWGAEPEQTSLEEGFSIAGIEVAKPSPFQYWQDSAKRAVLKATRLRPVLEAVPQPEASNRDPYTVAAASTNSQPAVSSSQQAFQQVASRTDASSSESRFDSEFNRPALLAQSPTSQAARYDSVSGTPRVGDQP